MELMNFDFNKARQQANEIENISADLRHIISNKYAVTIQGISTSWKGDSADAYMRKAYALQDKLCETEKQLRQTSESIRRTIRAVEIAEERVRQLAAERQY